MRRNGTARCGGQHCQRLGAPSCDYCRKPALKRVEAMRIGAEAEVVQGLQRLSVARRITV